MTRLFSENIWNESKGKFEAGAIEISGKSISEIEFGKPQGVKAKKKTFDLGELFVGPSAVDLHVHARDFEESHKETFETCEAAAKKGGVSVAACLANSRPRMDSVERVKTFLKRVEKLSVKFVPFATVTENLEGIKPTDWDALLKLPIAGLSDDGKPILNEKILRGVLLAAKKKSKLVSLHEEDTQISKASQLHFSESSVRLGIEGSPVDAETSLVERDLKIAAEVKAHIHFGHISSAKSVKLIRQAKNNGQSVSAEITPHHAHLYVGDAEKLNLDKLSLFKVCPPIRDLEDRDALRKGVLDGTLDCFASDHAPHSSLEKDMPLQHAAHGIVGLEYFFPLYNELRLQIGLSWQKFYTSLFYRPAHLLMFSKAEQTFDRGSAASLTIFDPNASETLHWSCSKSNNTPFEGRKIRGKIYQHWILGKKVYDAQSA